MTSVVEFLGSFVLFLVILTAFFSLAQLRVGTHDQDSDYSDRAALLAVQRLTESEGYAISDNDENLPDIINATTDWHLLSASQLSISDVRPGIGDGFGGINPDKISGLRNLTAKSANSGLGMPSGFNIHICITIVESFEEESIGRELFCAGADINSSAVGSTAQRKMQLVGGDVVSIRVGVFTSPINKGSITLTEIHPEPVDGGPEWIEIHNSGSFARELDAYGIRSRPDRTSNYNGGLIDDDTVLPGGGILILTGGGVSGDWGNSSIVLDVGTKGWLAFGGSSYLNDEGVVELTYSDPFDQTVYITHQVEWDENLATLQGQSLIAEASVNPRGPWIMISNPTPGFL